MAHDPTIKPEKMLRALLEIGAQHPVWNPDTPQYDALVNGWLATAREAVDAQGADDDAKADWCADRLAELGGDIELRSMPRGEEGGQ